MDVGEVGMDMPVDLLDSLEGILDKVQSPNSTAEITSTALVNILSNNVPPLAFYEGSLEYPPCSESVIWFINDSENSVSGDQLNAFRKIKLANDDVSNVRPAQALNDREVKRVYTKY
ncbi:putative carbonic anhydrase 3 [Belonocnema kinseyi]|uniref:putative carbonic anhydrase 3 n=1 Tax=Belonocnema kinseyi TaxID=2817044 RepID=UPI00143D404B|nr:putative carbonic anhydrase 3 [Belonocnema kinseyi]